MPHESEFLRTLDERGFIHQCSDFAGLDALARRNEVVGYIGFDCTAVSLHIGSLIQIMMLYWLQQTGNKAVALMGGGTTRVGDPSGRDQSRKLLSVEEIEANKDGIKQVFARFLRFGAGKRDAIMLDNA
ncbi:MAG: tyrosine--tRNA ligase, partial [Hyphomicrobiales bacterium]|nr:tyrosine--tRNA ligase [Hyphomicrobiales bacterium]